MWRSWAWLGLQFQNHAFPSRLLLRNLKQDIRNLLRRPVTFPNELVEQSGLKGSNWTTITDIWQNLEYVWSYLILQLLKLILHLWRKLCDRWKNFNVSKFENGVLARSQLRASKLEARDSNIFYKTLLPYAHSQISQIKGNKISQHKYSA